MTRAPLLPSLLLTLLACGETPAPTPPAEPVSPPAPAPRYTAHEWGLIGVDAVAADARGSIGTVVSHPPRTDLQALEAFGREIPEDTSVLGAGMQGVGRPGKPVIYLHVPDGAPPVDVAVRVGLPPAGVLEHWPPGQLGDGALLWRVTASHGACPSPAAAPTFDGSGCRGIRDQFCEAAEIPRYYGRNDTCLRVGDVQTELLFYRGEGADVSRLPLALEPVGDSWRVVRREGDSPEGPVLFVELVDGAPRIRALTAPDYALPAADAAVLTPMQARALLRDEATRRGLAPEEADAFLDAWSPAYFGPCLRTGPVAAGRPPVSFAEAGRALLYFAPEALVDRLLPLELSPPPEARHRVFLVRYVDPASRVELPAPP